MAASILAKLQKKLVASLPKSTYGRDPIDNTARFAGVVENQIELVTKLLNGESLGEGKSKPRTWFKSIGGKTYINVAVVGVPVDLGGGLSIIQLETADDWKGVYDMLNVILDAIRKGELNESIEATYAAVAAKPRGGRKPK